MRTGVLSDEAVKRHCPEYQPVNLASLDFLHQHRLQKHPLNGIKVSSTNTYTLSRFPLDDITNMGMVLGSTDVIEQGVKAYREAVGVKNRDASVSSSFNPYRVYYRHSRNDLREVYSHTPSSSQNNQSHHPYTPSHSDVVGTLKLRNYSRYGGALAFDEAYPLYKLAFYPSVKAAIMNLSDDNDIRSTMISLAMPDSNRAKLHVDDVLTRMNNEYRNSARDLLRIERAFNAAKRQGEIPDTVGIDDE
jgi:hypothetical protein